MPGSTARRAIVATLSAFAFFFAAGSQAGAAQVFNPGPFTAEITDGEIRIGEQVFDLGGGDPGTGPMVTGTIAANGTVTIPPSGIVFPASEIPNGNSIITVRIVPTTGTWTGSLDPLTGVTTISGGLRVKLENPETDLLSDLGNNCYIGNETTGLPLNPLTSETMPALGSQPAVTGERYDESTGKATLVNNNFTVPGASGCGFLGLGNSIVNDALGLPSAAGQNRTSLEFIFDPKPLAPIRPSFTVTPSGGKAPVDAHFDASATTVQEAIAPITEYRWDFDGDGTVDEVTAEPTVDYTYEEPGTYQAKLTAATGNGTTESTTRQVVITGAVATITEQPPKFSNSTSATFAFTNSEGTEFECRLDSAEFAPCETPTTLEGLTAGEHTFRVRAIDEEGSPGLPASYSWTVDLTAPTASFTAGPPARTNQLTEFDLEFTGTDNVSSPGNLSFECRYDSTEDEDWEPCQSPRHVEWDLEEATHTFQIRATDQAGNVSSIVTRTWVVDLTPPETNITDQPMNTLTNTPATESNPTNQNQNANSDFAFTSNEAGSTFICKFNDAAERACTSPIQTGTGTTGGQARLGAPVQGVNTFQVWAVDSAGNRDPQGKTYTYTYDSVQPTVTLPAGFLPPARTNTTSFNALALSNEPIAATSAGNAGTGWECSFDSTTSYQPCTQVITETMARYERTGIAQGAHTIRVRATDKAGNLTSGGNIGTYAYTVDLTAPVATINSGPASGSVTNDADASFAFSATDAFPTGENGTITFQCRRDAQPFASCTSPQSYSGLANGSHTFDVRPVDQAGNVGATVSRTWTIGTGSVTLDQKPAKFSNTNAPTFEFSSANPTDTFECRQKAGTEFNDIATGWAACTSPRAYAGLAQGQQWFEVRTVSEDGTTRGFPTVYGWFVDTVAPTVNITGGPPAVTNAATGSGTITFTTADASPSSGALQAECRYDSTDPDDWEPCTSPQNVNWDPVDGEVHNFQVRATDPAGNVSNVQTRTWTVDARPPVPSVSWAGPAITSQLGSANSVNRFDYSSDEPTGAAAASAFRCQFNNAAERNCAAISNGATTGNLQTGTGNQTGPSQARAGTPVQGVNTLKVWAIDASGNRSPDPAEVSFTYDTVQPAVTPVLPDTSIRTNSTAGRTFVFTASEVVDRFECSLNSTANGDYSTCTGSGTNATAGTHQLAGPLSEGTYTVRVRGVDRATPANVSSGGNIATYSLVVDLTNPTVAISGGPADGSTVSVTDATFTYGTTNESGGTNQFECKLDDGDWEACGSTTGNGTTERTLEDLEEGEHTFQVRATDGAGNTGDATSRTWNVDVTGPDAEITSAPDPRTTSQAATIEFASEDVDATFECKLDDGDWEPDCESPAELTGLDEGTHRFKVRASDSLGNAGMPASAEWEIDLTGPGTSIDSGPSGLTNSRNAAFGFSANEDNSTFECRLDSSAPDDWANCDSGQSYSDLSDGQHKFDVRATDDLGNTGSVESRQWTVDATAPSAQITSGPSGTTKDTTAQFAFTANEAGSTFECSLDGGAYGACTSPKSYSGIGVGAHTFRVRAKDAAGNVSAEASRSWTVETDDPPPPPPPADKAPNVKVKSGALKIAGGKAANVGSVKCQSASGRCSVSGTATLKVGKKKFEVKVKVPKKVSSGSSAKVTVKLSKKAFKALAKAGKGKLQVKLTVTSPTGIKKSARSNLSVKPKG